MNVERKLLDRGPVTEDGHPVKLGAELWNNKWPTASRHDDKVREFMVTGFYLDEFHMWWFCDDRRRWIRGDMVFWEKPKGSLRKPRK